MGNSQSFCFYDDNLHSRTDKFIVQLKSVIQDQSLLLNRLLNLETINVNTNDVTVVNTDYRPIQLDDLCELDSRSALLQLVGLIKSES